MRTKLLIHLKWLIIFTGIFVLGNMNVYSQDPQQQGSDAGVNFTPRALTDGLPTVTLQGDLTIAANNILNRREGSNTAQDPYDGGQSNNGFIRDYINVDPDGGLNFSSSSARINAPDCSRVEWAGLYWTGSYIAEVYNNTGWNRIPNPVPNNDWTRSDDFQNIRFRIPGSGFVDITADDVIYNAAFGIKDRPYACFKDVTSMLQGLPDANGEYTVANVKGTRGITDGGSAGWVLVVIYENPTMPSRHITVFDGFRWITTGGTPVTFDASGFTTIPVGPVRARLAVAALEGDRALGGDTFSIAPFDNITDFTRLGTTDGRANPDDNFFDATITDDHVSIPAPDRNIDSENTMGFDADIFDLNNPDNDLIDNGETGARFRMSTNSDSYGAFLATFAIDVIEPKIQLVKTVENGSGQEIGGAGVNLGQEIEYVISFQNVGNDDATNTTIRDILPANVSFQDLTSNLSLPSGVTYVYNAVNHEITFTIDDNLVTDGAPIQFIRFKVNVVNDCFELRDACSNEINNQAFATYRGVDNPNAIISDDPSVRGIDDCFFGEDGPSNFIVDIDDCNFERNEVMCGSSVTISAGEGFVGYQWYTDLVFTTDLGTGRTIIDTAASTELVGETNQTITVTEFETYGVVKTAGAPCLSFDEIIHVVPFTNELTNPVVPLINDGTIRGEVEVCTGNGQDHPKIYLCGLNDTALINTNITDAQNIFWDRLTCASGQTPPGTPDDECPAINPSPCSWEEIAGATGPSFTADTAGEYRIRVVYQDGCQRIFYFDVYTNELDPQITANDIICNTPGSITVNTPSASAGYEFQLMDNDTGNPVGAYQSGNLFNNLPAGDYYVNARQTGIVDGCVFPSQIEQIRERDPKIGVSVSEALCANDLVDVTVQLSDADPDNYIFELIDTGSGGTVGTSATIPTNFYEFTDVAPGDYRAIARSINNLCVRDSIFSIVPPVSDLTATANVSQNVTCREGNIQLHSSGGQTPHNYAIYSYTNTLGVTTVVDPSSYAWQTSAIFDVLIGEQGTYQYIVVDQNNCTALSNEVTIDLVPPMNYSIAYNDETCFGANDGSIIITMTDPGGYTPYYSIDGGATFQTTSVFTDLVPGNYNVIVRGTRGSATCDFPDPETAINAATQIGGSATLTQELACDTPTNQMGIIEFTAPTGGSGDYEYSVGGAFVTSTTFTGLTAGTYTPQIRDANNTTCAITLDDIVIDPLDPPTDLDFVASAITCNDPATDLQVNVIGGTGTITYEMTAAPSGFTIPGTNTTGSFTDLDPGTYTFEVTDENNCIFSESHTISDVTPITISAPADDNICFGATNGALTFTVGGIDLTSTTYSYTVNGAAGLSGQTSPTISLSGLSADTYEIIVTDESTGCTATAQADVNQPAAAISLNETSRIEPSCGNGNTGTITFTANGGWGGYTYNVSGDATASNGSGTFSLGAGNYTITVEDTNNCSGPSINFTLTDAPVPTLDLDSAGCYDPADPNSVTITATALETPAGTNYSYTLNGSITNTTGIFNTNIGPGTHSVVVTNTDTGCSDAETTVINDELTVAVTPGTLTACSNDFGVSINTNGGSGTYVYAIALQGDPVPAFSATAPTTFTVPSTFTTGNIVVYVRDNNGVTPYCEDEYVFPVTREPALVVNTPAVTDVLCNGESTGVIDASGVVTGGDGNYQYELTGGSGTVNITNTTGVFNNLAYGTNADGNEFTLTVRDNNGAGNFCEEVITVDITQPDALNADADDAGYTCENEATITVENIVGGSGSYEVRVLNETSWVATALADEHTFTQTFTDGSYIVQVRDVSAPGCVFPINVVVDALPAAPALSEDTTYNCDGTGNIEVTPFDAAYQYQLENGSGAVIAGYAYTDQTALADPNIFTDVPVGNYIIRVDYGAGTPDCTETIPVSVNSGNVFSAEITTYTNVTCNGANDGTITFEVENFDPVLGYEYTVNGVAEPGGPFTSPTRVVTNLAPAAGPAGVEIVITDQRDTGAAACIVPLNQEITEPAALVASINTTVDATCTTGATLVAGAVGGNGSYVYQLEEDAAGNPVYGGYTFASNLSNTTFSNIPPGDYVIRVRDNNESAPFCEDTETITVDAPNVIEFEAVPELCYSGSNDGTVTVTIDPNSNGNTGNGNIEVSLNGGTFVNLNAPGQHVFSNLAAGTYTVDIRDEYGCTAAQQTVTIDSMLFANLTADAVTCNPGNITVTPQGGDGNYMYAYVLQPGGPPADGDFVTSNVLTVDGTTEVAGTYNVYVRDNSPNPVATGTVDVDYCEYMQPITVGTEPAIAITTDDTQPACFGDTGSIEVEITSGDGPFTITVDDGVTPIVINNFFGTSRLFSNLTAAVGGTSYDITVTDTYGCTTTPVTEVLIGPDELIVDLLPRVGSCTDPNPGPNFGFEFDVTTIPAIYTGGDYTLTYSDDAGVTSQASAVFTGYASGTELFPTVIATHNTSGNICTFDYGDFIVPYPLDDLGIDAIDVAVSCPGDLEVTVQGFNGLAPYQYTYSDDPANFDPSTALWQPPVATAGPHTFTTTADGIIPGRTYIFYVRDDTGCVRESTVNINDFITNVEVTGVPEASCDGANDGEIEFTLNDIAGDVGASYTWELFDLAGVSIETGAATPFTSPGTSFFTTSAVLSPGQYYVVVTGASGCEFASENIRIEELDPITGTPGVIQDITCSQPGLVNIPDIDGGDGTYTYTLSSTNFVSDIVTSDNPIEVPLANIVDQTSTPFNINVDVVDGAGCIVDLGDVSMSIAQNPTILVAIDNCASPTVVTVTAGGTAGPFSYSSDGGTTFLNNGGVFTNLTAAAYDFQIRDNSTGCISPVDTQTIHPTLEATVQPETALLDCLGNPEEISINVTNGSGDYDYVITGAESVLRTPLAGPFPFVYSASTPGIYTIRIFDNLTSGPECFREFTVEIDQAQPPVVDNVDTEDAKCDGGSDGTVQINLDTDPLNNLDPPYTYVLTNTDGTNPLPAPNQSGFFSGLEAAEYTYIVRSDEGCETLPATFIIGDADPITFTLTPTQFTCTANALGNAQLAVTNELGGSGPYIRYEFILDPSGTPSVVQNGTNPNYITADIAGGTYEVNVYDSNGCVGTLTETIAPVFEIADPSAAVATEIVCGGTESINVTLNTVNNPEGIPLDLDYIVTEIDGTPVPASSVTGSPSNPQLITGLDIGEYVITVVNNLTGCEVSTTYEVTDPNTFSIDVDVTSEVICRGGTDGTIDITLVEDPSAPYAGGFGWEIFNTNGTPATGDDTSVDTGTTLTNTDSYTGLAAGDYYVVITQTNNPLCQNERYFSIVEPTLDLTASVDVTPITCSNGGGTIEVINAAGGWGGYTYYIGLTSAGAPAAGLFDVANQTITGQPAGTYQAWIMDSEGCMELINNNIILTDPTTITATLAESYNCNGNDGQIAVNGTSGGVQHIIPPSVTFEPNVYTYQLVRNGVPFGAPVNQNIPGPPDALFTDLGPGVYTVEVTDQYGCSNEVGTLIEFHPQMNAVANVTGDLSCVPGSDGEITVTVTGGSGTFTFSGLEPDGVTALPAPASVTTTASGVEAVYTGLDDFSALYTFTITDDNTGGTCSTTDDAQLIEPETPAVLPETVTDVTCVVTSGIEDGTVQINLDPSTMSDSPYNYRLLTGPGGFTLPAPNNTGYFEALAVGSYTYRVTSDIGCLIEDAFNIDDTPALTLSLDAPVTEFVCMPDNTPGTITITANAGGGSGTGNYLYSIDINGTSSPFGTDNVFEISDSGVDQVVTITVRDANSTNACTIDDSVTLITIPTITDVTVAEDIAITCTNDETVDVTVTGGSGDFTFDLLPLGTAQQTPAAGVFEASFTLTQPGDYVFLITDDVTGCTYTTDPYTVDPYDTIEVTAGNATPVTCISAMDGTMEIDVTGYSGPYDYVVLDDTGALTMIADTGLDTATGTVTISGLAAGNYTVQVRATAAPYCPAVSNNITIPGPSEPLDMGLELMSPITCVGGDGAIRATAHGGWNTSYTYTITYPVSGTTATNNTGIFSNLGEAGIYTVDVTDAGGCTEQRTLNIDEPVDIVINSITATPLVCEGDTDGTITVDVDPTTGRGPAYFEYILINHDTGAISDGQSSNVFTDLTGGNYSVQVIDGWNCDATAGPVTIGEPAEVIASVTQTSPLTCDTQAEIEVSATGGDGGLYRFSTSLSGSWSAPAMTFTQTVGIGSYQFYAMDGNLCISEISNRVTIDPVTPLEVIIDDSAANLSCFGDTDAEIRASARGGLGSNMYELYTTNVDAESPAVPPMVPAQPSGIFSGLGSGTYYVRVVSVDCEDVSGPIEITDPTVLQIDEEGFTNPTCAGEGDGTITFEVSGGTGTIKYAITPDLDQFDVHSTFENLSPGTYTVIAQDVNGCYLDREFTITDPAQLMATQGTLGQEHCTDDLDGTIEVLIEGGTAPYRAAITYPGDATDPLVYELVTDTGDPTMAMSHTFGDLAGGITYTILILDDNECTTNLDVSLDPSFDLTANVAVEYGCEGNSSTNTVTVNVLDPTAAAEELFYTLNGVGTAQLENVFTNVPPGDHFIEILAPNGCVNIDIDQVGFTIEAIENLGIEVAESNLNEFTYNGLGGVPPYEYYVDGVFQGTDNTYRINRTDTYTVRVVDSNGCEATGEIFIEFYDIEVPPVFTPDNDGTNDQWEIINDEGFPNMVTKVYDRYGRWLATLRPGQTWDGMYDGKPLPSGDYWYVIKINGENDPREFIGHFTLYR